jgi:hypothetical protein
MKSLDQVEPRRLYALADAREFIPSPRGGAISKRALEKAVKAGRLKGHRARGRWLVWGAAILEYLCVDAVPQFAGRTPARRKKDIEDATKRAKALGVLR